MPRPKIPRTICGFPANGCFKPNGVPMNRLEQVHLADDEFEALRLVDLLGLRQQQAAVEMKISRQTLANILKTARFKVTSCLSEGKALILQHEKVKEQSIS